MELKSIDMDKHKLITVIIWATIILVVYEALKTYFPGSVAGSTPITAVPTSELGTLPAGAYVGDQGGFQLGF